MVQNYRLSKVWTLAGLQVVLGLCFCLPQMVWGARGSLVGCSEITSGGDYVLTGDIVSDDRFRVCLNVHDTNEVNIDCAGFTIQGNAQPGLQLTNVQNFSVKNCNLVLSSGGERGIVLQVLGSSHGEINGNTVGRTSRGNGVDMIEVEQGTDLKVHDNIFFGKYLQAYSQRNSITHNSFTCVPPIGSYCATLIDSHLSQNNQISGNQIDGIAPINAPGPDPTTGAYFPAGDDGIVLTDETGDIVSGNNIANTWDDGIEFVGINRNLVIAGNSIRNVSNDGIGGWYWFSLIDSVIEDNTVDGAGLLFAFSRSFGLRPQNWDGQGAPADTGVYFTGNHFLSNVFKNSYGNPLSAFLDVSGNLAYDGRILAGETRPLTNQFFLNQNTFTGNDFGTVGAVNMGWGNFSEGLVIDGGNNACVSNGAKGFPLACGPTRIGQEIMIAGTADSSIGTIAYVTIKGQNFSGDPAGAPGAYLVSSPDCTVVPGQTYSYDGPDPSQPNDSSYRQINLAIDSTGKTTGFSCTFVVTRASDQGVKSVWISGLGF